ncbi:uncharacterized protein LOC129951774 [Eupeodes corollae]|uniref:uncharacterized protein LOC129951774 n=1 Tax=Eupeodes corollae TaxID=290404 RepID=UPI002491C7F9|nr:uncharacterized protein LOC129951774 [Eupeodes corollae]
MSVFDPLGLINHFTSYLKVLLQQIWCSKVDWDDEIENEQHDHWLKWLQQLHEVESIHIPRCYTTKPSIWNEESIQIHIFVDASKNTSAAVAYMRIQTEYKVSCKLLASKTKVAPIKLTSIPRLELIAALIGARLACSIGQSLSNPITKIFYWSDSVTLLRWLRSDAKTTEGQFVAFRIAEIQELSNIGNWRYVPSDLNVADDATKWKKGPSLNMNDRWFKGPEFLLSDEIEWPDDISLQPNPGAEILEAVHHICEPAIKFENFSSWFKILRLTAFVHRGIQVIIKRKIEIILFSKFLMSYEI